MLVKAFSSKPLRWVHYSHPMLSDSSIRRLVRQRNISQRCRNQNASLVGLMRPTRLALRGRHRFPIGLSFLKHPEAGLSEVTCDGGFGFAVAPAGFNPLVKPADMTIPTAPRIEQCAIGRLDKSPLQIHIDIAPYRAQTNLAAARALPRHQPAVARQLLSTVEPLDGSDLGPDHYRQNICHPGEALKPLGLGAGRKDLDLCPSITLRLSVT